MSDQRSGDVAEAATLREHGSRQRVFGRYTLIKILGRGAMGVVWLARDEELEREVALKFLPNVVVHDRSLLDELKRETRRSLELTHRNIVRIHDFVFNESSACISMEYVDGNTLANLRVEKEQKVFEPNELSGWTSQLCDALDYAHNQARIVHRDLKPANLMVNAKGDLKVSDFGIARSLGDTVSRLTMEQARSGTLVYMSPQQLDGEGGTHLDDIYSLGASLYELLTSKPPFYSGNIDRQIHERIAPSMTERRKELNIEPALVPQVWEDAVAACLAKDPAKRPQSAAQVAQRLPLSSALTRTVPYSSPKRLNKKLIVATGIAAVCVLMIAGGYFGILKRNAKRLPGVVNRAVPTAEVSPPQKSVLAIPAKSIAVLPFENLSSDKENAFFTDGVQDEILANLAKVADLKVISRTSVMLYKSGNPRSLREIGQQLGVAHVLEGSVQRAANRVRVMAQLIDARTDAHLWAQTYDRDLADVFAIQSEIAQKIADQLQAKLSPKEKSAIDERPTSDLAAYDLFLRAKERIYDGDVNPFRLRDDLFKAVQLLDQAVARDPAFLLAHCQLAYAHDLIYWFTFDDTKTRLELAETSVRAAVRLRPDSGETHLAQAIHFYWGYLNYDRAREELAKAQHALPNDVQIFMFLGLIDRRQGRWDEAIRNFERVVDLDPRNVERIWRVGQIYSSDLRRYRDAIAMANRALALEPRSAFLRALPAVIGVEVDANMAPLRATLNAIEAERPASAAEVANISFQLALRERDPAAAAHALANIPSKGEGTTYYNDIPRPHAWFDGLLAKLRQDAPAAHSAFKAARAETEKLVRAQPGNAIPLSVLALIDAELGEKEKAIQEGRTACDMIPVARDTVDSAYLVTDLARIYALAGEKDLALKRLEIVSKIPCGPSYGELRLDSEWDSLRGDPRFEKIVASLAPKAVP